MSSYAGWVESDGRGRGRPRSEQARAAVLHAADDLLVEVGYAALTMKGIAERAGVSRMTVYRWWATKAEILLEATADDAAEELTVAPTGEPEEDVTAYLRALLRFLASTPAGGAYRALIGESQHDRTVAELLRGADPLETTARPVVARVVGGDGFPDPQQATAALIGPVFYAVLTGQDLTGLDPRDLARRFLRQAARDEPDIE